MDIKRIGIDLAKQVFQLHGVNSHEQPVLKKRLKRAEFLAYLSQLEPCTAWKPAVVRTIGRVSCKSKAIPSS
jgi:transposase